jgi:hypothetical protein
MDRLIRRRDFAFYILDPVFRPACCQQVQWPAASIALSGMEERP